MLFYFSLFVSSLYFKIARVHAKEEKRTTKMNLLHILSGIGISTLIVYGVIYTPWYYLLLFIFLNTIFASLMVTAVQLGIFIDGKPILGLSRVYKFLPLLSIFIVLFSSLLWSYQITA